MSLPDISEATLSTRLLMAVVSFFVLALIAAVGIIFSMMMVLFSADAGETNGVSFEWAAMVMAAALVIAVIAPPLMLLFRVPFSYAAIPAACGFGVASATLLWFVATNLEGTG